MNSESGDLDSPAGLRSRWGGHQTARGTALGLSLLSTGAVARAGARPPLDVRLRPEWQMAGQVLSPLKQS